MRDEALKLIEENKLIAFIRTSVPEDTEAVVQALFAGGIRLFAVSVAIPHWVRVIENLNKREGVLPGVASVLDGEIAHRAIHVGAKFVMSPCTDKDVVNVCKNSDTLVIQAATTPTEAMDAVRLGVDLVEVYPVDLMGGHAYIEALRAPLPFLKLVASGGITVDNSVDYLKEGATAVVLANGLIDKSFLRTNNWGALQERAQFVVTKVESLKAQRIPSVAVKEA
ncbi:MAG TPA: bifunctional 4-hydroxy-2-oxoglutarate aldolase/2-dehydro-3-deoxy-phosphogluconate aldolase [Candidatus Omnitrophota bacterium]|nr:bifunctional 4-hydroxy-2-oxoglutarate aldolase/2-dehydro-3-deoxy-phosphogluconate aldolase [Candidatus Omnitrophota bacterium]